MATHNILGSWGEKLAREHLLRQGYTIVDSNVKIGHNEIDFIATFRNRIIFVEVKTRSDDFADPLMPSTLKKSSDYVVPPMPTFKPTTYLTTHNSTL